MGRKLELTPEQIVELFNIKAQQFADKYGYTRQYVATLKYRYKQRLERATMEREPQGEAELNEAEMLGKIKDLLDDYDIDPSNIDKIASVEIRDGEHTGFIKNEHGEIEEVNLPNKRRRIVFKPVSAEPQQEIIREAPPTIIKPAKTVRKQSKDKRAIIVPDLQGGFRRIGEELEPIHDERVVEVGLQIIRHAQPDLIVLNGDNLDFPDLSHYMPDSNHFQVVMQATIDRVHEILATMRASAPDAEIVYLAGNHEARLNKQILKHNMHLWGIKRPKAGDDYSWLSVGHLLNLQELDIRYISGYPANSYLINDRLQAVHGDRVRSNGSTAPAYANQEELSTIYGHVHRREAYARTNRMGRVIMGLSYGTWARTDGAVPSYGNGVDDEGRIVPRQENWQNGLGFIEYQNGDKPFTEQFVHIDRQEDYETKFDGKVFKP